MDMREHIVNKNLMITIPHHLRKKFRIEKGTKVYFIAERDGIKILPIAPRLVKLTKLNLKQNYFSIQFPKIFSPSGVIIDSGWNWTPLTS